MAEDRVRSSPGPSEERTGYRSGDPRFRPPPVANVPASLEDVFLCDRCGSAMFERHCRLVCPTCGSERDCSDP